MCDLIFGKLQRCGDNQRPFALLMLRNNPDIPVLHQGFATLNLDGEWAELIHRKELLARL